MTGLMRNTFMHITKSTIMQIKQFQKEDVHTNMTFTNSTLAFKYEGLMYTLIIKLYIDSLRQILHIIYETLRYIITIN